MLINILQIQTGLLTGGNNSSGLFTGLFLMYCVLSELFGNRFPIVLCVLIPTVFLLCGVNFLILLCFFSQSLLWLHAKLCKWSL